MPQQLPTPKESDFPPAPKKLKFLAAKPSSLPQAPTAMTTSQDKQAEEEPGEEDPLVQVDYF